jgi:outer membrane protein insertion porin family
LRKPLLSWVYGILGYTLQNYEIYNVAGGVSPAILAEEGTTTKSMVSTALVWDRRDNPFLTRRGEKVSISSYVSGGPLGGDEQIYGFDVQATKYFRFPGDLILVFDVEAATVDVWNKPETKNIPGFFGEVFDINGKPVLAGPPGSQFQVTEPVQVSVSNVPIFDRLYLGGSNNLRGFRFRDISPKDSRGQPIGGQSMARATVELTFPIIEKARGAIFYDAGLVNPDAWDFGVQTLEVPPRLNAQASFNYAQRNNLPYPPLMPRSTFDSFGDDFGIGVRLDLPIGPLRLDYGFPIHRAGNTGHGHLNFSVGYQF